jgi:hypothetical protein
VDLSSIVLASIAFLLIIWRNVDVARVAIAAMIGGVAYAAVRAFVS